MADEKDAKQNQEENEDTAEQDNSEEQPQSEEEPESKESKGFRERLRYHAENVAQAISRMEYNRTKTFYFCTIPGILRLVQFTLALLNISMFGYFCTSYEKIEHIIPPYCLAQTRELYFMLCNYHSLIGCFTLILAGIVSKFSNAALMSSLYPFLFDTFQAILLFASSTTLMQFYRASEDEIEEVMPEGYGAKQGMSFAGFLLFCIHLASAIYDILLFINFLRGYKNNQNALIKEQESMLENS